MSGSRQTILVENNGLAHTENFTLVEAAGLSPRDLVPVVVTGHNGKHLTVRANSAPLGQLAEIIHGPGLHQEDLFFRQGHGTGGGSRPGERER